MANPDKTRSRLLLGVGGMWLGALSLFTFSVTASAVAQDTSLLSGNSSTIFRTMQNTDGNSLVPVYEYLNVSALNLDKNGRFSLDVGGWGRTDLGRRSTNDYHDGDLQYGYITYHAPKNNLVVNLGRQFITEGVASEKVDGLYLGSDFKAGFGGAAFVGAPVVTEPNSSGGDLIFGGRVTNSNSKYYTFGISALKANHSGSNFREEEGVDLWLHPFSQIDIVGRSSYNSITGGWMEHDYKATYTPLTKFSFNAGYSDIHYKHYFFHMTTNVFSLLGPSNPTGTLNPNEELQSAGGSVAYTPSKAIAVVGDYKKYQYWIAGDANYYGGKATFLPPGNFVTGVAIHRMDGSTNKLRYIEYRVFASKKIYKFDLTADSFNLHYDSPINGVNNSYSVIGAASYELTHGLKIWADIDYSKNPYYNNNVAGLFKLTYAFDVPRSAEERGSEGRSK